MLSHQLGRIRCGTVNYTALLPSRLAIVASDRLINGGANDDQHTMGRLNKRLGAWSYNDDFTTGHQSVSACPVFFRNATGCFLLIRLINVASVPTLYSFVTMTLVGVCHRCASLGSTCTATATLSSPNRLTNPDHRGEQILWGCPRDGSSHRLPGNMRQRTVSDVMMRLVRGEIPCGLNCSPNSVDSGTKSRTAWSGSILLHFLKG